MKIKLLITLLFLSGNLCFGSGLKYWGSLGAGLGLMDLEEFIYSPLDVSANISINNFLLGGGIDLIHRQGGVCALTCYDYSNKFIWNGLIGYVYSWNKFGFSFKSGISYAKQYGGYGYRTNGWEFGIPIKAMFMMPLNKYVGVESGINTWVRKGQFLKTDYYSTVRLGLVFGLLPK